MVPASRLLSPRLGHIASQYRLAATHSPATNCEAALDSTSALQATNALAIVSPEAKALHSQEPRVWVEKTLVEDRPDRQGGADRMGVALWSPQRSSDERDVYANMRDVSLGDFVLHLTDNAGSRASPSLPGRWTKTSAGSPEASGRARATAFR